MEHVSSVRPTGKFPEKVENIKRWSRFPGWNFRTECRVPLTFLVVCTSSRSTIGHPAIPRKSGKYKKVVPFSRLEFPNGMSCSIDVSCSLYQFQVHDRAPGHVPGFTTKWNNFLPIGNSTFATTEISGFFS